MAGKRRRFFRTTNKARRTTKMANAHELAIIMAIVVFGMPSTGMSSISVHVVQIAERFHRRSNGGCFKVLQLSEATDYLEV